MTTATPEQNYAFLISCVRHGHYGTVDFAEVTSECDFVVSKGAAAKRWERLRDIYGIKPKEAEAASPKTTDQTSKTSKATTGKGALVKGATGKATTGIEATGKGATGKGVTGKGPTTAKKRKIDDATATADNGDANGGEEDEVDIAPSKKTKATTGKGATTSKKRKINETAVEDANANDGDEGESAIAPAKKTKATTTPKATATSAKKGKLSKTVAANSNANDGAEDKVDTVRAKKTKPTKSTTTASGKATATAAPSQKRKIIKTVPANPNAKPGDEDEFDLKQVPAESEDDDNEEGLDEYLDRIISHDDDSAGGNNTPAPAE